MTTEVRDRAATPATVGVGADVRRREVGRFVQGKGNYVDDIKLPGTLHVNFVRSPAARARILGIDASAARALAGVVAVYTAADLDAVAAPIGVDNRYVRVAVPLARDVIKYVGEPLAMVIAEDPAIAEDAADLVALDLDHLPAVVDPERAMAESSPLVWPERTSNVLTADHFTTDDVDAVFASAYAVVEGRFHSARITACPIEPRAVIASFTADDRMTLYTSTAGVHGVRTAIARALGMSESHIEVIAPDVGGSFGAKNSPYPEELAISAAARLTGRPLKWVETRIEHLTVARQGRDQWHEIAAAVAADGRVLGIKARIVADDGAAINADTGLSAAYLYLTGAYDIREYRMEGYAVSTNKAPHGALRGIGKADAAWVIERMMDRIATRLGIDPVEIRLRNVVRDEQFPYEMAIGSRLDSGQYETAIRKAAALAGYARLREEQAELRAKGIHRGIGVAIIIEPTSASRRDQGGGYAACRLRMDPSGRVTAFPSVGQQGQGHQTAIAQIVAGELGIGFDDVDVQESDTDTVPWGPTTGSSRSSVILMPAVYLGAQRLRDKLLAIAAHRLQVDVSSLTLKDGAVWVGADDQPSFRLRDLSRIAHINVDLLPADMEPGLEVIGTFKNPNIVWDPDERGRRSEFAVVPYDIGVVAVDVDVDTGRVSLVDYTSVHDCGTPLNPRIVRTQHLGCIVHGVGAALYEELRFSDDGNPESSTFMDYLLPTVNEVPPIRLGHLVTPTPYSPLGAKGAGETGMLSLPPAIGNAIEDALRDIGAQVSELPYTAVRVKTAIRDALTTTPDL